MMTRKDYVKVASILNDIAYPNMDFKKFEDLITEFSDMFIMDNPNFSPVQFESACLEEK
jgi:hypothetical protein